MYFFLSLLNWLISKWTSVEIDWNRDFEQEPDGCELSLNRPRSVLGPHEIGTRGSEPYPGGFELWQDLH